MGIELGHTTKAAFKKHTGSWGAPSLQLGASDGFELNSDSLKPSQDIVPNRGNFGSPFQRPGVPGMYTVDGDVNLDMYYQCFGHRFLAMLCADTVTALGGGAQRHDLVLRTTVAGIFGSLVIPGTEGTREYGCVKPTGVKLRWDEGDQRGKLVVPLVAFDYTLNVGTPNDAFVSVDAAVANGARTIVAAALAIFTPSPITVTKAGTVTAINLTIKADDRWGRYYERTVTEADFVSNVFTDTEFVRRVISITINSFTGSGNVRAGVSNGPNNDSTVSAITMESSRECSVFTQMEFFVNRQGDPALAAADEQFLKSFEISIEPNLDKRVTTQFGNRIDEPSLAGGGEQVRVRVAFELSAHTDRNRTRLYDSYQGNQLKAKAVLTGPQISSSGTPHKIEIWMNGLQCTPADGPNVGGAGVQPVSFAAEAHLVPSVPTGFPAGADEPCMIQITNALATAIVTG